MKWRKLKHFMPEIPGFTHAALPTFHDGRVFFSPRDSGNRSHVYFAHFDPEKLEIGLPVHLFGPGKMGSFDDSGTSVCQIIPEGVMYLGWNLGTTVPFRNTLALWNEGKRTILKQRDENLLSISYGWWNEERLFYHAIYGWSAMRTMLCGEPQLLTDEIASRPCVLGNEMWYSYRLRQDDEYRIGYARIVKGSWKREPSGIHPSGSGFDADAVAYPCVFDHNGKRYMLYNGNGYGKTGFGLAVMED